MVVKVEVDVLGSIPAVPNGLCGRKAIFNFSELCSEFRSCSVKVEVDVLGSIRPIPNSPYGRCGRKAILNLNCVQSSGAV